MELRLTFDRIRRGRLSLAMMIAGFGAVMGTAQQCTAATTQPTSHPTTQPIVSFKSDVAPILVKQCLNCHNEKKAKGGYRLDTFEHLEQSGDSDGAPIIAEKPGDSVLFKLVVTGDEDDRMPKKADALPAAQIAILKRWIEQGAKFDGPDIKAPLTSIASVSEYPAPPLVYPRPIPITAMAFSPDGQQLAASGYHEVVLWNPDTGAMIRRIQKLPERIYGLAWSPDGQSLAIACGSPGKVGEVRRVDLKSSGPGEVLDRISDVMLTVRFSPDGKHLAAGGADNAIRIYDIPSYKRTKLIEQHGDWVTDLAFSPDSTRLASASRDKSARIFDVKSGEMQAAFLGEQEAVFALAWDPSGKVLFTCGHDRAIHIWNPDDSKKASKITGFEADPFKLEVGMGFLFAGCADGIVRQYSLGDRTMEHAFPRGKDWVYAIALDESRKRIAAGSYGGEIFIWEVSSGEQLVSFVAAPGLEGKKKK